MISALSDLPFAHVLPANSSLSQSGGLMVAGCDLRALAEEHGTPLYVFDEDDFRETVAFEGVSLDDVPDEEPDEEPAQAKG